MPQLYVRPRAREFGRDDEPTLADALDRLAADTLIDEVGVLDDLKLDPDGRLAGGYRFTSAGLKQVCGLACPGLYSLLVDMAGARADSSVRPEEYSFELARRTYNRVVEVRIGRFLSGQRLLRNAGARTVDGVCGPRYVPVTNRDVYEQAREAARDAGRASFCEASLAGRRLAVRFESVDGGFSVPWLGDPLCDTNTDRYWPGYYFANSEAGGESTIRAAPTLARQANDAVSLGRYLGGRVVHAGRRVPAKVAAVFAAVRDHEPGSGKLRAAMVAIRKLSLGLGLPIGASRSRRVEALVELLRLHDVPKRLATRAVLAAMYGGAGRDPDPMPQLVPADALARRTAFDLYSALTVLARPLYATRREAVQQAAHRLLLGKIRLG